MRADANAEGDKMAKCFAESHEAYSRGDGAGAKQLSNEGKEHQVRSYARKGVIFIDAART